MHLWTHCRSGPVAVLDQRPLSRRHSSRISTLREWRPPAHSGAQPDGRECPLPRSSVVSPPPHQPGMLARRLCATDRTSHSMASAHLRNMADTRTDQTNATELHESPPLCRLTKCERVLPGADTVCRPVSHQTPCTRGRNCAPVHWRETLPANVDRI